MSFKKPLVKPSHYSLRCEEDGFTILELIMVIIIVGIIAAVAIVPFGSHDERVATAVANMIITDIAYAQELAQIRNTGVVVTFDPGQWFAGDPNQIEFQDTNIKEKNQSTSFLAELESQNSFQAISIQGGHRPQSFISKLFVREAVAGWRNNHEGGDDDDDDDDDDDGHGKGKGKGHGDDDDDDGHGHGKGKGHGDDDDDYVDPGGYTLAYEDGSPVSTPEFSNANFDNTAGDLIQITSPPRTLIFDGTGVLHVPNYNWGANETSIVACTLNDLVSIRIARFSGKTWIE